MQKKDKNGNELSVFKGADPHKHGVYKTNTFKYQYYFRLTYSCIKVEIFTQGMYFFHHSLKNKKLFEVILIDMY